MVPTPDGKADAALFHPAGNGPMARRADVAGHPRPEAGLSRNGPAAGCGGYTVLVPNPFYRTRRAPDRHRSVRFQRPRRSRRSSMSIQATLTDAGIDQRCGRAHRLPRPAEADRRAQGRGRAGLLLQRAASRFTPAQPAGTESVRSATFHGGGLVTKDPNSPHLLIPKTEGELRRRDRAATTMQKQPDAKDVLKGTFAAAERPGSGGSLSGGPRLVRARRPTYDERAAERAWAELLRLYRSTLV